MKVFFFLYILSYLFTIPNLEERESFINICFKTKEIKKMKSSILLLLLSRCCWAGGRLAVWRELAFVRYHRPAVEQLVCLRRGACAGLFSKMVIPEIVPEV